MNLKKSENFKKKIIVFSDFFNIWKKNIIFLFLKVNFLDILKSKIWCGQLKIKLKKTKSAPHMRIWSVGWRMSVFRKKKFYSDVNQTENFIGTKTENNIYYKSEKHY